MEQIGILVNRLVEINELAFNCKETLKDINEEKKEINKEIQNYLLTNKIDYFIAPNGEVLRAPKPVPKKRGRKPKEDINKEIENEVNILKE
jgi:hypothetical protein